MSYLLTITKNKNLALLNIDYLKDYILSTADIQTIDNLNKNPTSLTASLHAELLSKVGPGAANKQQLNSTYVQIDNKQGFRRDDFNNFKKFIKHNLVGHLPIDVSTLKLDEIVE